jgi:hypothetical protein
MKGILINDLIDNISKYKLLFCPLMDYYIKANNRKDVEELAKNLIDRDEERTIIFLIDKNRKYITCFIKNEENNDISTCKNKKQFKDDENIINNLNEFVMNILDIYNPIYVGIIQELEYNKYKSLKAVNEYLINEELWNTLLSKEVRCRYCNELMYKSHSFNCKNGDGYRQKDWYVKFENGNKMNLEDYIDMNKNLEKLSKDETVKLLGYELKDR